LSSVITQDSPNAIYFDYVNAQTDPLLSTEGVSITIGDPNVADPIIGCISIGTPVAAGNEFGGALFIGKKQTEGVLSGSDASNFVYTQQLYTLGVGLVAPRALARMNVFSTLTLGPDRLHFYPIYLGRGTRAKIIDVEKFSHPIEPLLFPRGRNGYMPISANVIYGADMKFHDDFLFLAYPVPGQTSGGNQRIYVNNTRSGGWTVWGDDTDGGMPVGCLIPVPPDPNSGALYSLYFGGTDGQVYKLDPGKFADQTTPYSPETAIPFNMVTGGKGRAGAQFRQVKAIQGHVDVNSGELLTVTISDDTGNNVNKFLIQWPGQQYSPTLDCDSSVTGNYCTIGLSGNITTEINIYSMDVVTSRTALQK
jgi:hypothetical protein